MTESPHLLIFWIGIPIQNSLSIRKFENDHPIIILFALDSEYFSTTSKELPTISFYNWRCSIRVFAIRFRIGNRHHRNDI